MCRGRSGSAFLQSVARSVLVLLLVAALPSTVYSSTTDGLVRRHHALKHNLRGTGEESTTGAGVLSSSPSDSALSTVSTSSAVSSSVIWPNEPASRDKYTFTANMGHRAHAATWWNILKEFRKPNMRALEVGCFEGEASTWLLDNLLLDPGSTLEVNASAITASNSDSPHSVPLDS